MTKNFKILSGSTLKLIAVISMFIDHAAHILMNSFDFMGVKIYGNYTVYYVLRLVGRLAFPIFCFLIVEGFLHTRNVKKYCMRLAIFAVISEIPFNLMLSGKLIDFNHQNVYFTLLFGVIALELYKYFDNHLLKFCAVGIMFAAAGVLNTDYGIKGVALIVLIYILRESPSIQVLLSYFVLAGAGRMFALAAFVPINMYNGERGFIKSKPMKFAFYVFYPAHILLLVAIKYMLK